MYEGKEGNLDVFMKFEALLAFLLNVQCQPTYTQRHLLNAQFHFKMTFYCLRNVQIEHGIGRWKSCQVYIPEHL